MDADELGRAFEGENERADLEQWRCATDAERGRVIAELIAYGEAVVRSTGIRNTGPARTLPRPRSALREGNGG